METTQRVTPDVEEFIANAYFYAENLEYQLRAINLSDTDRAALGELADTLTRVVSLTAEVLG
jgi:hypothetical protein